MSASNIMLGNCLDILPTLPTAAYDLILCDPPYGITSAGFDCTINLSQLWPNLWRLAKPYCPIILTGVQPFSSVIVMSQIHYFKHEWVWIKNRGSNFANTIREPMKEHEHIMVFSRNSVWTYNKQMQERTGGGANRVKYSFNHFTDTENYNNFCGKENVTLPKLRVPSSWQKFNCEVGLHPQQKPIELFRYLIRTYSDPGAMVLDFAAGSATTAIAAMREGRSYLCIEKEARFVDIAAQRILKEEVANDVRSTLP